MQFLKLGEGTYLRAGLIAGVAFGEDGAATVSLAGGGEPVRLEGEAAQALARWLESNSSEVAAEDEALRGVYV